MHTWYVHYVILASCEPSPSLHLLQVIRRNHHPNTNRCSMPQISRREVNGPHDSEPSMDTQQRGFLLRMDDEQDPEYCYSSSEQGDGRSPMATSIRAPTSLNVNWKRILAIIRRSPKMIVLTTLTFLLLSCGLLADSNPLNLRRGSPAFSPPWYPAPLGGKMRTWEASYSKAAALVSQMTLLEKGI